MNQYLDLIEDYELEVAALKRRRTLLTLLIVGFDAGVGTIIGFAIATVGVGLILLGIAGGIAALVLTVVGALGWYDMTKDLDDRNERLRKAQRRHRDAMLGGKL